MIRLLWCALVLAIALVATGAELDRRSRRDASVVALVPPPFRSFAQQHIATARLLEGDGGTGLIEARKLVRRRPIPAENLYLLAWANHLAGHDDEAGQVLGVGAGRGWRAPQLQVAMIGAALGDGLVDAAAARLLALWSIGVDPEVLAAPTRQVFATAGGAEAFGKILAASHFAQDAVLKRALSFTTPQRYAAMVHSAILAGADFNCAALTKQAQNVSRQGHEAEAHMLAQPSCANARQ